MERSTDPEPRIAALSDIRAVLTAPGSKFEVVEEDVRGNRLPVFKHRARLLRELLEGSERFADRTFVVDGAVRLDFRTFRSTVDAVASGLQHDLGVLPGDRVALFAANRWEWVVAFWAIASAGAVPALFNGWWTPDEFAHAANLVAPVLVLGDAPRLARVASSETGLQVFDLDRLDEVAAKHEGELPDLPTVAEDDPAVLIFTSGTTGRPKAVTVPHRAICGVCQVNAFGESVRQVVLGGPVPRPGEEPAPSDDIVLVTSPLFHVSMLQGAVLAAIAKGSTFVLLPGRFEPERVLKTIERERVTMWMALGSAAPRVCASPAIGTYDTSSVRYLGIGGAPVSPSVQNALRSAFPTAGQSLGMGYTSTEAGAVVANIGGPEFAAHPTSTGRVTVTTDIELRDPDGHSVPEGERGEVHVRSAYLMLGYWNDPVASAAVVKEGGWLAMGDVARFDGDLLYIDSRARDMILVSAENVSPTEVEHCLEAHPAVLEAAVFAVDDNFTGDAVCAVLTLGTGPTPTVDILATWCQAHIAQYKVPTRWYLTEEALPRTASGKLTKHELRTKVEAGHFDLGCR